MPSPTLRTALPLCALALALLPLALASSGDRNPTFQHCLKGCGLTYCDPSQPPLPLYLSAFGWTCEDNCRYGCMHSFVDNIRAGSQWHQFYGKWPFYRLGPIQEPLSVVFSLGNLWVHLKGMEEVRRRVHAQNSLRNWLLALGGIQVNTWVWSAIFHIRDLPITERLDYFSATLTIAFSLLYTLLRVFNLITPAGATKLTAPCVILVALVAISHFTYLLSFPIAYGSFPYGYHTAFNVVLALIHSFSWIGWTSSFYLPTLSEIGWPRPYPPQDPLKYKSANASVPAILVGLTTVAMSFELLDFAPIFRLLDAHAMWHLSTIPLGMAWWHFLCSDAIELEGAQMQARSNGGSSLSGAGAGGGLNEKMPLTGGGGGSLSVNDVSAGGGAAGSGEAPAMSRRNSTEPQGDASAPFTPNVPAFAKLAAGIGLPSRGTPGKSPGNAKERED